MEKGAYITTILRSKKTVFSFKDIALLWGEASNAALVRINYYVKKGSLYQIRRGIYAKDKNYNKDELATKIFTPSYISFETVLAREGIIFQYHSQIFVASYLSRNVSCDNQIYSYKKIKYPVLINPLGIINNDELAIATLERAFLDTIYSNKEYYFDNLAPINWEKVFKFLPIYNNKRMSQQVTKLSANFKK